MSRGDFMEQLVNAISDNFSAILSGFFGIVGVFLGWFLNLLTTSRRNRPQLSFVAESTPNDEVIDSELRTKTSASEWSIRIINTGRTACFIESFEIVRKGHTLVDCYCVCSNHDAILPNGNILYTLMEQDADALQYNFSLYYRMPSKVYLFIVHAFQRTPILGRRIIDPEFKQGECEVIAYGIDGRKIYSRIDLSLLYIRHRLIEDTPSLKQD